jgi:hypothetical protein
MILLWDAIAVSKFEYRNSKIETNPKYEYPGLQAGYPTGAVVFAI